MSLQIGTRASLFSWPFQLVTWCHCYNNCHQLISVSRDTRKVQPSQLICSPSTVTPASDCIFPTFWSLVGYTFNFSSLELREQDRRRRGRPRLRWEDCVKRDVRKAGEEEDWKKKTRDRGGWKRLSDEVVKKLRAGPHAWQLREKEEERGMLFLCC